VPRVSGPNGTRAPFPLRAIVTEPGPNPSSAAAETGAVTTAKGDASTAPTASLARQRFCVMVSMVGTTRVRARVKVQS
jgi:hypothetical protein